MDCELVKQNTHWASNISILYKTLFSSINTLENIDTIEMNCSVAAISPQAWRSFSINNGNKMVPSG